MTDRLINGRIVGGDSLHDAHKPELCTGSSCGPWRTVACGGPAGEDRDIDECAKCGKQKNVRCNFDDDFA